MRAPLLFLPAIVALAATLISCGDSEEVAAPTAPGPTRSSPAPVTPTGTAASTATTSLVWTEFTDEATLVSFPAPPGLARSESRTDITTRAGGAVQAKTITLSASDGRPVLSLTAVPNPEGLSVEDWVSYYPGWPGEPKTVTVAGSDGLLFEEDQAGDDNPTVYFARGDTIIGIRAGVQLRDRPGVLTRADFDRVLQGIEFPP